MDYGKVQKFIHNHPRLDLIQHIFRYEMKDAKKCREMLEISKDPMTVKFEHYGNDHLGQVIYHIGIDNQWKNGGYCHLLRMTLLHLKYADDMGFIPCIVWPNDTLYSERDPMNGETNPFEYFFENPCFDKQDIKKCNLVVYSKMHDALKYKSKDGYLVTDDELNIQATMIDKYLKFNKIGKEMIETPIRKLFDKSKVLGVHVRGTDFNKGYYGHPIIVSTEDYLKTVEKVLEEGKYDSVFIATDEEKALDLFKYHFGNLVIYNEVLRSKNGQALHTDTSEVRVFNKYYLGLEILKDLYALSLCDSLIAGHSNVSIMARALKMSYGESFRKLVIIDNGINVNMRKFR